MELDTII